MKPEVFGKKYNLPETSASTELTGQLEQMQKEILELVALGHNTQITLNRLCNLAESMVSDAIAIILVFDETDTYLDVKAAPSMPKPAIDALNGLTPGSATGSCGNAVFHNQPQFVSNTQDDPRWENVRQFAHDFGIKSCWSMPIRIVAEESIGSFSLSSFQQRPPTDFHKRILEACAHIASIVIKRQLEEQQLWYLAHHDPLTNLPNRILFNTRLDKAIDSARYSNKKIALLFLDLDRFKKINDTLGHEAGDELLKQAANRIKSCIRNDDTLARMGGDEFVILIKEIESSLAIKTITEKILATFNAPFTILGKDVVISSSVGISIFPDNGKTSRTLQQNADFAMYKAKASGRNCFVYFDQTLTNAAEHRMALGSDLDKALQHNELILNYQPQYCFKSGKLEAVEVLVRWLHPSRGLISPAEFIPIAEETGQVQALGQWVTQTACRQCKIWWDDGLPVFSLAINLSVKQLQEGFTEQLTEILAETGFPINKLEMEITESLIMERGSDALSELHKMKAMGIGIAMDDFGTGHSSLAQLKHLPISKLKIDRGFVEDIPDDNNDMVIARTIIRMGHSLGLKVVAEGVENELQKEFLVSEGCDLLQGYLLARPMPADKLGELLEKRSKPTFSGLKQAG